MKEKVQLTILSLFCAHESTTSVLCPATHVESTGRVSSLSDDMSLGVIDLEKVPGELILG